MKSPLVASGIYILFGVFAHVEKAYDLLGKVSTRTSSMFIAIALRLLLRWSPEYDGSIMNTWAGYVTIVVRHLFYVASLIKTWLKE